jgi:lysophospholipase L1-like esterase
MKNTSEEKKLSFLALGDSYTIGEAVPENECWPMQLVEMMNNVGKVYSKPQIIATTGWTSDELIAAIKIENPQGPFDLVSLLIGVNNQYRGYSKEVYAKEFQDLLNQAIDFAGKIANHVVVVSIPDWGATPFAKDRNREEIALEIDQYNFINHEISRTMGVHYIDITPGSRLALSDYTLVTSDKLHPSGTEYQKWANAIYRLIAPIY